MASGFPGSIDNFTDPLANSPLNSPSHATLHSDVNDAVEKIETYMGLVKVIPTGATNGTVGSTGTVTVNNGVTSVTVAGAFSALYDNYEIIWSGGTMTSSSNDSQINVRLGASATGYRTTLLYNVNTNAALGATSSSTNFQWGGGGSTSDAYAHFRLFGPFLTRHTRYESPAYLAFADTAFGFAAGVHSVAASYTDFTLIVSGTGTMSGGSIRIYGYRN